MARGIKSSKITPGAKFHRLTVLAYEKGPKRFEHYWICRCDCGEETKLLAMNVRSGNTRSCGCVFKEVSKETNKTHGMSRSAEHRTWIRIKRRCYSPKHDKYEFYGGRGIRMSDEWKGSFEAFYRDMGPIPGVGFSIERVDPNGDYCKENCKWLPLPYQCRNTRNTIRIPWMGRMVTTFEIAESSGIDRKLIVSRIKNGWPLERILSEPKRAW